MDPTAAMNVLITGAAGFLGSHLADRLTGLGHFLVLYDLNFTDGPLIPYKDGRPAASVRVQGDIREEQLLLQALGDYRIDAVVHLAALLTSACEADPVQAVQVNCQGSAAVFEAARKAGVKRVVFGSSVAVFNDDPGLPRGDERPYGPVSVYGATKVFTEQLAAILKKSHPELDLLGLRFGWIYGPGRERGWTEMNEVIEGFALEQPVVRCPDYSAANDWTYIDDAGEAVVCALRGRPTERIAYNVSGDYRTIQETVAYLQEIFPHVRVETYPASLPAVGWNFVSDGITRETGFSYRFPLEAGLDLTVGAMRSRAGLVRLDRPSTICRNS